MDAPATGNLISAAAVVQLATGLTVTDVGPTLGEGPIALKHTRGTVLLDEGALEKHLLFLGSIGSGKTNAIFQAVHELRRTMTDKDVMVIFDSKGDYLAEFYDEDKDDKVISSKGTDRYNHVRWNLFRDIRFKTDSADAVIQSSNEVTKTLFDEVEQRSKDLFFPYAARDITQAVFVALTRKLDPLVPTNADIRRYLYDADLQDLRELLSDYPDLRGALQYISLDTGQTQGVLSTIKIMVQDLFRGPFGTLGDFSIREFVSQKGSSALFVEYEIESGRTLTPIYRVLCDLAIKEALSRQRSEGNVYFIIDEFSLLPNLYLLESGLNFGRSLGVRFVVGTQNVSQVYEGYGRERGLSILASFGSVFIFRLYDAASRIFASDRYGANLSKVQTMHLSPGVRTTAEQVISGRVIEDWHIAALGTGQAIVSLHGCGPPRLVQFRPYQGE